MKQILLYVLILGNVFSYSQERGVSIATQQATPTVQGDVYALVVGISNYPYIKPLNYADNDAELFANYLRSNSGGKIKEENLVLLTNDKAKSGNFWANFMKLSSKVKSGDRYYIYFAGHGDASKEMNEYFLLLQDCQPAGDANNYLAGSSTIQIYNLKNRIGILTKKGVEVVLILDACRSNELVGGYSSQAFNQNIAESKVGEILMLATGQGQVSIESQNLADGHGLFTYNLIDGLSGAADKEDGNNDGKVSLAELQDWVKRKVRNTAEQKFKTKQTPFFCCSENENTILALTDSNFNKQWETVKTMGNAGNNTMAINTPKIKRNNVSNDDTAVIALYNKFSNAIKQNLLWGDSSANYYYDMLNKKYPNTSITEYAGILFSAEGINLVQTKINLYLEGKDEGCFTREFDNNSLIKKSISKMFAASKLNWTNASKIYSKSLEILKPYDSAYVKSLMTVDYILKARSYLDKTDTSLTIEQSLNYAKKSYDLDNKSIIAIQTILWNHYITKQYDSALVFAEKIIKILPKSNYGFIYIGNIYGEQNMNDSAICYYKKALQIGSEKNTEVLFNNIANIYRNIKQIDSALCYYKKALQINPKFSRSYNNIAIVYINEKKY
ncbi:MAG: caspase family protein, partial [Bacteroidetes bacterium]|nr:caspase family protein [Bacteroidota bacterium]